VPILAFLVMRLGSSVVSFFLDYAFLRSKAVIAAKNATPK
jgi:hypothetical protein